MPVNQLIVDTLMLRYPKATAEQIRSKYIQQINKQKLDGIEAQEGFNYINSLVDAKELKSQPAQPSLYMRIGNCRSTRQTINMYNEIQTASKEMPSLKLFYDGEFKRMLEGMQKNNSPIPRKFVEYLLNNTKDLDDANNIRSLVNDFGSKKQKSHFNRIFNQFEKDAKLRADALRQAELAKVSAQISRVKPFEPEDLTAKRAQWQKVFEARYGQGNVEVATGVIPKERALVVIPKDAPKAGPNINPRVGINDTNIGARIFGSPTTDTFSTVTTASSGPRLLGSGSTAREGAENIVTGIKDELGESAETAGRSAGRIGKKGWIGIAIAAIALITGLIIHNNNKKKAQNLDVAA